MLSGAGFVLDFGATTRGCIAGGYPVLKPLVDFSFQPSVRGGAQLDCRREFAAPNFSVDVLARPLDSFTGEIGE
jgi:hypothetical protein